MDNFRDFNAAISRRQFFRRNAMGLGAAAFASLLGRDLLANAVADAEGALPHFAPKAKRAIYLSMLGAPAQQDLFDYKPNLKSMFKQDLKGFLETSGQRLTTMTSGQEEFPVAPSIFEFKQHGESGAWVSELLPYTSRIVDEMCIIKSMHTEAINHEPANQLIYTGTMQSGKPSIGSWLSYGLGSMSDDLPAFVVLHAYNTGQGNVQAISARLWGAGFLPGEHAGVAMRTHGDPVLFLKDSPGISRQVRRTMLDGLNAYNEHTYENVGDDETRTRMQQYEMAFRMQSSVPELVDFDSEPEHVFEMYGSESPKRGSFANSCLLARRLLERGTRFVQIFHRGWDQHATLPRDIRTQCFDVDQACYALIQDLKMRGMLEDTLVVWGGEFGRTTYSQGDLSESNYGRDHHPRCFTIWMAGGGVKPGIVYGETDDLSFNITKNPVHIRDLHATILRQLGINHEKFTFKYQGLDQRLTGVEKAHVVEDILA